MSGKQVFLNAPRGLPRNPPNVLFWFFVILNELMNYFEKFYEALKRVHQLSSVDNNLFGK